MKLSNLEDLSAYCTQALGSNKVASISTQTCSRCVTLRGDSGRLTAVCSFVTVPKADPFYVDSSPELRVSFLLRCEVMCWDEARIRMANSWWDIDGTAHIWRRKSEKGGNLVAFYPWVVIRVTISTINDIWRIEWGILWSTVCAQNETFFTWKEKKRLGVNVTC